MDKKHLKHYLEQGVSGAASDTRVYAQRYTGYRSDYMGNGDQFSDLPNMEDPISYVTHRSLEQKLEEQEKEKEEQPAPEEVPEDPNMAEQPPDQGAQDPNAMGMDPSMAGQDPNAMGMQPGMDMGMGMEPMTSSELGRVYELKKIYSRLTSIETYLVRTTDPEMLDLRKMISQAIDLFELVISNYQQYKDRIDEIIILFYKLLDQIYDAVRKFFHGDQE